MKQNQIELQITVPNQTRYLHLIGRIGEELAAELHNYSGDRETLSQHINLVLTEALVNAIRHANANNPDEVVTIRITTTDDEMLLQVFDHGQGFDIEGVPDCLKQNGELQEHGRGLYIIRTLMDSVQYRQLDGGNVLEMKKRLT